MQGRSRPKQLEETLQATSTTSIQPALSMASRPDQDSPSPPQDLSGSQLTIPSDSEPYSSISPPSSSPPQSSNNNGEQPVIIYHPPTFWSILRGAAINLLLPFVNGMMLGFGELLAHEWAFRLGWNQTNVSESRAPDGFCHTGTGLSRVLTLTAGMASASQCTYCWTWCRDARTPCRETKTE